MFVVVPNSLRDAINAKLDTAIAEVPEAASDCDALYEQLLAYVSEHGVLPDFSLKRRDPVEEACIIGKLR